jgi:S-adenosylmethionine:tRNA ribosyltransferase-isomerase
MIILESSAEKINFAKDREKKVCVVGTTTVKALESSMYQTGRIKSFEGWTSKFIFPPHRFLSANAMVTNFHPSESPMLMIAAAFGGYDFVMKAYKEAIAEKYRFLTYGDAMLII